MMNRRYFIETYGCQMNVAESKAIENALTDAGWSPGASEYEADLILLNTCSVRNTAENRIWGRLGYYKTIKKDRSFLLGVMGCMTERLGAEIRKNAPEVDILIGTFGKSDFVSSILSDTLVSGEDFIGNSEYKFAEHHSVSGEFQAMLPIMHGCNNFCTYCIVPHVRGREISREPGQIIRELHTIQDEGRVEVTLLGQNVNSYHFEKSGVLNFADLLKNIINKTEIPWIRFISSHPKDLSDELLQVISDNPRICRHIHLPVQHGSSYILKQMNRKYSREDYLALVKKMRDAIPDLSLTTDILIGFPGESEEDFKQTKELIREVRFNDAFTYQYNAIKNTAAYEMDGHLSQEVKGERLAEIIEIQRAISFEEKKRFIGTRARVLVERVSKKSIKELLGRTENNNMVVFSGKEDLIGSMCDIKINKLSGNTFSGVQICHGN